MKLWIKICGLTTDEGVAAALAAGADAIGFVFAPSKRRVTPAQAAQLTRDVPSHLPRIAVTLHPEQSLLDEVWRIFRPDVLQTDAQDLDTLKIPAGLAVLPVVRGGAVPDPLPARLLFEGPVSGTGITSDWTQAAPLSTRTQLILAGGLNAANVAAAIREVGPFGIDVSSGVERAPGIKDPARIHEFVQAARHAASTAE